MGRLAIEYLDCVEDIRMFGPRRRLITCDAAAIPSPCTWLAAQRVFAYEELIRST
jgi:hypothetical protein